MRRRFVLAAVAFIALVLPLVGVAQEAQVDRTALPIAGPWYPPITTLDARDAKAPPVFEVTAPKDAPNVVIILLDDIGFHPGRRRPLRPGGPAGRDRGGFLRDRQ